MGLAAPIGIAAAAGLAGSAISSSAAKSAAKTQARSADNAAAAQLAMYNQVRQDLSPYREYGTRAGNEIINLLFADPSNPNSLRADTNFTQADLEATPGYKFTLGQGLKATQNSAAARGLGVSGAAMRGAADYATGLSDQTYNTRFNQRLQAQDANYNRLIGMTTLGQNAAAMTGAMGLQSQNAASQFQTAGANAIAAGKVGSANAWGSALNNAGNLWLTSTLLGGK